MYPPILTYYVYLTNTTDNSIPITHSIISTTFFFINYNNLYFLYTYINEYDYKVCYMCTELNKTCSNFYRTLE